MKKQSKPAVVSSKTLLAARAFEHLSIDAQDELLALMRTMVSQNQSEINQNQFGYRIKEIREGIGMTREELSKKSGISRTTISALESGNKKTISSKALLAIATALGTTVDHIFYKHVFA